MRTSYSALETYKLCPRKYKFQEIDKIKAPKSKEAVFGTLLHDVLRFVHSQDPNYPDIDKALNFYKNNWNKEIFANPEEEKVFFNQGAQILREYYRKNDPKKFTIIGLETHFEMPIGNHVIAGKIDRIDKIGDNSFEIIDYKTGRRMPSQEDVDENMQLAIYNLGFIQRWPDWENANINLSLHFLKHGEKLSTKKTKEQLEVTKESILKIINEITDKIENNKVFEPILSKLCDFCGYKKICPMWKDQNRKETDAILDKININEISDRFLKLKKQESDTNKKLAEIKEIINLYCDKKKVERIFGKDGNYIMRSLRKTYKYDSDKIKEILEPLKLLDKVTEIDKNKLSKLIKTLPRELKTQIENAKKIDKEYKALFIGK